jgi:hypothetical protein
VTVDAARLAQLLHAERVPGWATVELERAEREVTLARGWPPAEPAADDGLLGAFTRIGRSADRSETIVLLEPSTEGLLAATLARFGEGFLVDYLLVDRLDGTVAMARREGVALSAVSLGPFGAERLVTGGPRWGPHLILAEHDREPAPPAGAVTIES